MALYGLRPAPILGVEIGIATGTGTEGGGTTATPKSTGSTLCTSLLGVICPKLIPSALAFSPGACVIWRYTLLDMLGRGLGRYDGTGELASEFTTDETVEEPHDLQLGTGRETWAYM